jgi:PAS domain S-box-containing protein
MATELRQTGINVVGDMPWGTHFCHFYETKQDLLELLVPYFKVGLESNEFCLWVISDSDLITVEETKGALAQAVPDLDQHLSNENIEILKGRDWYFENNALDIKRVIGAWDARLKLARARGFDGLRVSGDTFWLVEKERRDFFAYEKQLSDWMTDLPMTVFCTCPLAKSGAAEVLDVVQTHRFAIARRQGRWEIIETPELIQAKAEIERLNAEKQRVIEQTNELRVANEELRKEIAGHKQVEEKLTQSESQLAEAQRLAHVGSWNWDLRSNAVSWSDELYRIFDLPAGTIGVAGDVRPFIHPDDLGLVWGTVQSSVKSKEPYSFYYRVVRPDGSERTVHSQGHVLCDEDGEPIRVFGATQDVTSLKRAEDKLKATTEQLRALSARLQSAREEEGIRIAREIHDELGSALTSLRWDLERIEKLCSESGTAPQIQAVKEKIAAMVEVTDTTLHMVRRIASELRPTALDDFGLVVGIRWQARQFQTRTGLIVHCHTPVDAVELNQEHSTALFRIFQEALTNILRHAKATRIDVSMVEEAGALVLTIKDNGRGITEDEKSGQLSIGLLGMRERAHLIGAGIDITGVEGEGTTVTIRLTANHPRLTGV